MSAKTELFDRLEYLSATVNQPFLIDTGIANNEHNGIASLLRKGLGIVAFNILEDFIKHKTSESLQHLSSSSIEFNLLTDTLKEASTKGALDALVFRAKMFKRKGADWQTLIQNEAQKIYSTQNPTFQLSDLSLVSSGSNITSDEIKEVIKAFGISGGWTKLGDVATLINSGIPSLYETYKNAASRRNSAAHIATFQYSYAWLENIKNDIMSICAAFDILLTARCRQVTSNKFIEISQHDINNALKFRFLEEVSTNQSIRETTVVNGRARKIWHTLDLAVTNLQPMLSNKNEFLILLDSQKRIKDWFS